MCCRPPAAAQACPLSPFFSFGCGRRGCPPPPPPPPRLGRARGRRRDGGGAQGTDAAARPRCPAAHGMEGGARAARRMPAPPPGGIPRVCAARPGHGGGIRGQGRRQPMRWRKSPPGDAGMQVKKRGGSIGAKPCRRRGAASPCPWIRPRNGSSCRCCSLG